MNLWQKYKALRERGLRHPVLIIWGLIWFLPMLLAFATATGLVFVFTTIAWLSYEEGIEAASPVWGLLPV